MILLDIVKLSVISDMGCQSSIVKEVIVHDLPNADFTVIDRCQEDGNIFQDISSINNGEIISVKYNFSDTIYDPNSSITYFFNDYGLYDVELFVTTKAGCSDSIVKSTEVYALPEVDFIAENFCVLDETKFSNLSSVYNDEIIDWQWTFGEVGFSSDKDPVFIFDSFGVHNINLSAISQGCVAYLDKKIKIFRSPKANFLSSITEIRFLFLICLKDMVLILFHGIIILVMVIILMIEIPCISIQI